MAFASKMKQAELNRPSYYLPWPPLALYLALLGLMLTCVLKRRDDAFWSSLPLLGGLDIGAHVSNLAIIFILHAGSGLAGLLFGAPFARLAWIGLGLLAINFAVEAFSGPLNVADWMDALYGVIGIALSTGLLWLMERTKIPVPSPAESV